MNRATLTMLLIGWCIMAFSQTTPQQEWVQTFNGAVSLNDGAFVVDVTGSIVVSGVTETTPGTFKILTVKYDPNGTQLWAVVHNTPGLFPESDFANFITTDNLGNIYIAGSVAIGPFGTDKEFTTIKYDASGVQQWVATHADSGEAYNLVVDETTGDVFVTGWTKAGTSTREDFTTVKYNSSGVQQWSVKYGGTDGDIANSIAMDGSGNLYITGVNVNTITSRANHTTIKYDNNGVQQWATTFTNGSFAFTGSEVRSARASSNLILSGGEVYVTGAEDNGGASDYITIKYNNLGVQQWATPFNGAGSGTDYITDLGVLSTGEIVVTGGSNGGVSGDDYVTVQYNAISGSQNWSQTFNGTANGTDRSRGLDIDNSDNIYVTGVSFNGTDNDFATIRYSSIGAQEWDIAFDGTANDNDEANDIGVDATGNIYVVGLSSNGTNFDYTTVKYSQLTFDPIIVTASVVTESCEAAEDGSIDATVSGGVPPYTFQWSNGVSTEDITGLKSGGYVVTVTDDLGNIDIKAFFISEPLPDPNDPPSCSDVFISEYCEGTGKNKAIEVYNPTDFPILLNTYFLRVFMNGAPTPLISQLFGIIQPKGTHVIAHPNASSAILALANQTSNKLNFNGDDPVQLVRVLNTIPFNLDSITGIGGNPHAIFDTLDLDTLDNVGTPGVWPGNQGYPVGSGSTKNNTLVRKSSVTTGKEDWSCGQKQWQVTGTDNSSNLRIHQSDCEAGIDDLFIGIDSAQITGTDTLFLEFDITVRASNDSTFLESCLINLNVDPITFGDLGVLFSGITVTKGGLFDKPTYFDPNTSLNVFLGGQIQFIFFVDVSVSPYDRTEVPTTAVRLLHVKIEVQNCNLSTDMVFVDTISSASFSSYTVTADDSLNYGDLNIPLYDETIYESDGLLDTIPCGQGILSFTSPVYPGTFYKGTSDLGYLLTITGEGFGTSQGSGNVLFPNANDGGQTIIALDASDFISWTDTEIKIKMPSVLDSLPFSDMTPGSGVFTIVTNSGDSLSSGNSINMPYSIANNKAFGKKFRMDLLNVFDDSTAIVFDLGTSITTHPDTLVESAVRKAVKDWNCFTQVNFEIGNETPINISDTGDGSIIHFVNAFTDPTVLGKTTQFINACLDASGDTVFFPKEIDIALLADPTTIGLGAWYFDSVGALPPNRNDFFEVILHEVGHAGLLKHVNNDELLNFSSLSNFLDSIPEISRRWISNDDYDGATNVIVKGTGITLSLSCPFKGLTLSDFSCAGIPIGVNGDGKDESIDIGIYPNPTGDDGFSVSYNLSERTSVQMTLIDHTGKRVILNDYYQNRGDHEEHIDTGGMASGLYIFILNINGMQTSFKVLKL